MIGQSLRIWGLTSKAAEELPFLFYYAVIKTNDCKNISINQQSDSSEIRYFKKPVESNIFVSTKKLKHYGTLQAKQKYK